MIQNETTTVPGSLSPTTHYSDIIFSSPPTHTGAKATSESVTILRPRVFKSTDNTIYTKSTVPSATRADQQLTTAKYKTVTHSRSIDLESSINILIPSMHMYYTSWVPVYQQLITIQ